MAKKTDKLSIFILACVILLFFLGWRKSKQQSTHDQDLMKSFEIVQGSFEDCGVGKTGDFGHYTFVVGGKRYSSFLKVDKLCYQLSETSCNQLKKYKFPVAYNPDNPGLNQMLLSKRDYRKYRVTRVDSLNYVFEKFFDCR